MSARHPVLLLMALLVVHHLGFSRATLCHMCLTRPNTEHSSPQHQNGMWLNDSLWVKYHPNCALPGRGVPTCTRPGYCVAFVITQDGQTTLVRLCKNMDWDGGYGEYDTTKYWVAKCEGDLCNHWNEEAVKARASTSSTPYLSAIKIVGLFLIALY
ncbi:unnamed protein product, partial [Mesorhabditis spiculigera]